MSDLSDLFHSHDKVARAMAERDAAGYKVDLERIKERMYELRSQSDPIASMLDLDILSPAYKEQRQQILDSIFYVVVGRHPTKS